jgi:hypothetical protein
MEDQNNSRISIRINVSKSLRYLQTEAEDIVEIDLAMLLIDQHTLPK